MKASGMKDLEQKSDQDDEQEKEGGARRTQLAERSAKIDVSKLGDAIVAFKGRKGPERLRRALAVGVGADQRQP